MPEIAPPTPPSSPEGAGGGGRFSAMSGPAKIGLGAALVILLLVVAGGGYWLASDRTPGSTGASPSPSALRIMTVPVDSPANPFTPPVAQDAVDVPPVETAQPTQVPGDQVGLYGGSKKINVCDKGKLIAFLAAPRNRAMGEGWATTIGIEYADIRSYIEKATSGILRSDTLVTNHGWENGRVTGHLSVLQAGTAVLINDYGVPVTRCYCGNPLTPPSQPPSTPPSEPPSTPPSEPPSTPPSEPPSTPPSEPPSYPPSESGYPISELPSEPQFYYGTTWPWWKPSSVTVIRSAMSVVRRFTFVNIYNPTETYVVSAGQDDTSTPKSEPEPEPSSTYRPEPSHTNVPGPTPTGSSPTPSPSGSTPTPSHSGSTPTPSRSEISPKPSNPYD